MIALPACIHRGKETAPGYVECRCDRLVPLPPHGKSIARSIEACLSPCPYRERENRNEPPTKPPQKEQPCIHLGPVLFQVDCNTCPRETIKVDVRACQLHGACTRRDVRTGYRGCSGCPDKRTTPKPIAPPQPDPTAVLPDPGGWLVNADGKQADVLANLYKGRSCFLLCGGPSLAEMPLHDLNQPGILTAAVNNCAVLHRPNLWFCVDKPSSFHENILRDPGVMKFIKRKHSHHQVRTHNGQRWVETPDRIVKLPNVWFYDYQDGWPSNFLTAKPTWGTSNHNDPQGKGQRSVMLIALRMLYWLGVRTVYLIGADFHMRTEQPYAFSESKGEPACHSNNKKFARLNQWFRDLQPHFAAHGFKVLNATNGGNCDAFERIDFAEAIRQSRREFPAELKTWGLYK